RCLDFSHLLMLSVEENCLPRSVHEVTLIPPHIREAFQLTTMRHKIAIYSYYFYRLIQRADHLTCVFNDNATGITRHEMSRFLRQLQAETSIAIHYQRLMSEQTVPQQKTTHVACTPAVRETLRKRFAASDGGGSTLSPSAINRFMQCQLMFYFMDVARIREPRDPSEGIDASLRGTIFHDTAEAIYKDIIRRKGCNTIDAATLGELLGDKGKNLLPYLRIVFDAVYFHPVDERDKTRHIDQAVANGHQPLNPYQGGEIIERDVILNYLRYLLQYDQRHAPFAMLEMEKEVDFHMQIQTPDGPISVRTGGRVDRIDEKDGTLRIVDYKTGNPDHVKKTKSIEEIFERGAKHPGYFLQALLYALAVHKQQPDKPLRAALLFPAKATDANYSPDLVIGGDDLRTILDEFEKELTLVVSEIFNTDEFRQTTETKTCDYCDLRMLCGR
ncbi:MAG: PD-(D/E)XK nuclease family protein, partial [Bacteroidaceae bacterium]|nr:PD-(D/E)XK nuclease family protein [Bacteroidaceae bacterium]